MKKAALIIFIFFSLWNLIYFFFPHLPKGIEYLSWDYKFELIKSGKIDNAVIIIGDSTAEAAIFPNIITKEKAYNLSLPGGTPFDGHLQLKAILARNIKPKKVIIAYGLVNFLFDDGFMLQNINYGKYSYQNLKESLNWQCENGFIIEDLGQAQKILDIFPFTNILLQKKCQRISSAAYLEFYLSKLHISLVDYARFKENLLYNEQGADQVKQELLQKNGKLDYGGGNRLALPYTFTRFNAEAFNPHPFAHHFFQKLLNLLKENSIEAVIEMPPIIPAYRNQMKDSFVETAEKYLLDQATERGFKSLQKIHVYDETYFGDYVHLNKLGSERFSTYLKKYFKD